MRESGGKQLNLNEVYLWVERKRLQLISVPKRYITGCRKYQKNYVSSISRKLEIFKKLISQDAEDLLKVLLQDERNV